MKIWCRVLLSLILAAWSAPSAFAVEAVAGKPEQSNQPVEVNADSLEVVQQDQKAIFRGNVIAVQGDMRLKSDVMTVFYHKKEGASEGAAQTMQSSTISRLETEGNVLLSTPEESASGATGTYDVDKKEIRLNGDVVLTRDKNILKGEHLVYDLTTGHSSFDGAPRADGGKPVRVRGLFMPSASSDNISKPEAKP